MARSALTIQNITRSGIEPTYAAWGTDDHYFPNEGKRTFIHVFNGDASQHTVTIQTPKTVDGLAIAERTVAIPASEDRMIGPFPTEWYNQADNTVYIDIDDNTSVTVAALRL